MFRGLRDEKNVRWECVWRDMGKRYSRKGGGPGILGSMRCKGDLACCLRQQSRVYQDDALGPNKQLGRVLLVGPSCSAAVFVARRLFRTAARLFDCMTNDLT